MVQAKGLEDRRIASAATCPIKTLRELPGCRHRNPRALEPVFQALSKTANDLKKRKRQKPQAA
jgi:hypothetical protein